LGDACSAGRGAETSSHACTYLHVHWLTYRLVDMRSPSPFSLHTDFTLYLAEGGASTVAAWAFYHLDGCQYAAMPRAYLQGRRVAMPPNSSDADKICTGPISIFRSLCCQAEAQINYRRALPLVVLSQGQKALAIKQNPCFKPGAPALKTDICGSRAHAQII